ncbi:hypothetical protein MUP00_10195 [Candidatus Bathyarchaeota archaeon]|nr:hypothetical protein [Candidatus Bathyarchaeota archaeon]
MTISRKDLRLRKITSLAFLVLVIAMFVAAFVTPPPQRMPFDPSVVSALLLLVFVVAAVVYVLKRKAASQTLPATSAPEPRPETAEYKALVEKYGLELTLALTNTARLEIVKLLIENPSGMTEDELVRGLGRNQPLSRAHLRSELEALSMARAVRIEHGRYHSIVDEDTVKLMESAKENEYSMYYRR